MTATYVPSPWPAPTPPASQRSPWRFAQVLQSPGGVMMRWVLKRNCSLAPRQLLAVYLSLCAVSLVISLFFWRRGATLVLPFAGLEIAALSWAVLSYARHAADHETLTLQDGLLRVEHQYGRRVDHTAFRACWVRVEPQHGDDSLVELSGQGQRARVGRYLLPQWRSVLAQELRRALRGVEDSDWN